MTMTKPAYKIRAKPFDHWRILRGDRVEVLSGKNKVLLVFGLVFVFVFVFVFFFFFSFSLGNARRGEDGGEIAQPGCG